MRGDPQPRKEKVLLVAAELFAREGYAGVGLREIAARAGIRAPSLFKHFRSKRALYNAVLAAQFVDLKEMIVMQTAGGAPFPERLERLVRGYVGFVFSHPTFPGLYMRMLIDHPRALDRVARLRGRAVYECLEEFLRAGIRAGAFRSVSPAHFVLGFTGAVTSFHAAVPAARAIAPIDLRLGRDRRVWIEQVLDMTRRTLLVNGAARARR